MRRSFLANLVILAVTVAIVAGAFASFQRKRSSFERIDFTFTRDSGVIVVKTVDPGSSAEASGLRPGDQIWLIVDTPSTEIEGLQKALRRIGQKVPLVINRGGKAFKLDYLVPELKIDYAYLILSFIGFLYLAIGIFTLFRGGRTESTLFFFVTLLSFTVYVYTPAGDIDATYKLLQLVEEFATILLPPLTLNFFVVFPRPIVRYQRLIAAMYIPPALLAAWDLDLLVLGNRLAIAAPYRSLLLIQHWELVHFAIYFTLAVVALAYTYRTAAAVGKKQIKWIYLGMALGFVPFLLVYLVPYLVTGSVKPIYATISILPLALIPLAFAVSILKYKLWDVEVVIKEILAYSVTFIFGMIAFSTINVVLSHIIAERAVFERHFLAFTSGLLIAGVLIPVKGRVESVIERFVYRDSWKHRRAISEFAQELATFHDVHELISMMRERLRAALGLQRMNLFTREGAALVIYDPEPNVPRRAAIVEFGTMPAEGPLMLAEPRLPEASDVPWQLLRAGYRYVFPLRNRGELQGVLTLGTKRGEGSVGDDESAQRGGRGQRRARGGHRRRHRARAPGARAAGQGAPGVARPARRRRGARGQHAADRHLVLRATAAQGHAAGRSKIPPAQENGAAVVPRLEPRQQPARPHRQPPAHARAGQHPGAGLLHARAARGSAQGKVDRRARGADARPPGVRELSRSATGSAEHSAQRTRRGRGARQHLAHRPGERADGHHPRERLWKRHPGR